MAEKSENKTEDFIDFDIDPSIILAYDLEKLNLASIPNDIAESLNSLEKKEVRDTHDSLVLDIHEKKYSSDESCVESEKSSNVKSSCDTNNSLIFKDDKNVNIKTEFNVNEIVKSEIINDDSISNLLNDLVISDVNDGEKSDLRERAPQRTRRHLPNRQNRGHLNFYNISEFDHSTLLHLSVGNCKDNSNKNLNSYVTFDFSQCYETDAQFVDQNISSPESGYVPSPSSTFSDSDASCYHPDFIDEENVIDGLVELGVNDLENKCNAVDNETKVIEEIKNFLKDTDSSKHSNDISKPNINETQKELSLARNGSIQSTLKNQNNKCAPIAPKPLHCDAKNTLRSSLNQEKYLNEQSKLLRRIQDEQCKGKEVRVIYVLEEETNKRKQQTNLHLAVINWNIEEIYNIVEFHKKYKNPFPLINNRDAFGKTALDYALENSEKPNMRDVVKYLMENTAQKSCEVPYGKYSTKVHRNVKE